MTTTEAIYSFLSSIAGLTAICGDRIYPAVLPQELQYPAVRFTRDDDGGFKDFDGQGGTIQTDLQVDCIAVSLDVAQQMAAEVGATLKNYTGPMGARTVIRASLESEFDTLEPSLAGGMFRASQAWSIWHY